MIATRKLLILSALAFSALSVFAQRTYKLNSVLASGNWFKISIADEGVYKIDVPFLNSLGITGTIPSAQIKIFGNGCAMLPEANSEKRIDDLEENSIWVVDGGDGVLNGSDYILFYAKGPHQWFKDSIKKKFYHKENLYSDKAFYYITIGANGLRIPAQFNPPVPNGTVTSFNERYFHELDTVNFLSSGREWYGEEFSNSPGRNLLRTFLLPFNDMLGQQATIVTDLAARSVNVSSRFTVNLGTQQIQQLDLPPISTVQYDFFARETLQADNFVPVQSNSISINYTQGSFNSQGWLNWFEFFCRRNLAMNSGKQFLFRDWNSVGSGSADFIISNTDASAQVWDVTDSLHPLKMNTTFIANQLHFTNDVQRLHEYVCFSNTFLTPQAVGRVANQNLHNTAASDLLIITAPEFLSQAQRLAQFHQQHDTLKTVVVTTDQVFNEFASGSPDPTAIRDFIKMYYDKYRATWNQKGKYALLFGKASFDYKNRINNNTNFVSAYETPSSLDPLSTYTSDDFFGFLDDNEDINSGLIINQLDVGIGRIPSKNIDEAKNFVDKIFDYHSSSSFGPWRNNLNFIADDQDNNLHLQDAETLAATVNATAPAFNQQKIYLDAFHKEKGFAGGSYPQANAVINNNIYNGTLLWNFSGHGGAQQLAEEAIVTQDIVNSWNNQFKLPLFITATCDFAPYDNPLANSLGENLLIRPKTGAIALMTTTRVVFAFSNRILNNNYLQFALQPDATGNYKTLGQTVMAAKNYTYQTSGDVINNRKFTLLGDPAMTVAFPFYKVRMKTVNGKDILSLADTLKATEFVTMDGEVTDNNGVVINNFNGTIYLSLFDKIQNITTLGNDPTSFPVSFPDQETVLFKGKASAQNGTFSFKFKMPKDINYQYGKGKISLYAQNGVKDGNGSLTNVIIGGIANNGTADTQGPDIKAFLNDEKFVNGSITNSTPVLIVKLADSSGINTGGSGVDHDIVATLDKDNRQYFVLNNFYETDIDSYQKGTVHFQLPALSAGHHSLKIKAWDVMNNSSEYILDFTVVNNDKLKIDHVLNYPNPFTTRTSFWFEHNCPNTDLHVKVEIFTVSGRLIKTISQTINTTGNRSNEIQWDGNDEYGMKIGKGVYIYRLRVATFDGKTADKWEKLMLLSK